MKVLFTAIFLSLFLLAMPAYSFQCPTDIDKIVAALDTGPDLTADELAEVEKLLAKGEAQHDAGAHAEAVATLAKAKQLLGIE
ncbi:MAG: hypothetical protein OES46_16600 [Gammaproteobacteria bacterium]|nr:hypothetical protein [Gammaproteobacteria bacterium]